MQGLVSQNINKSWTGNSTATNYLYAFNWAFSLLNCSNSRIWRHSTVSTGVNSPILLCIYSHWGLSGLLCCSWGPLFTSQLRYWFLPLGAGRKVMEKHRAGSDWGTIRGRPLTMNNWCLIPSLMLQERGQKAHLQSDIHTGCKDWQQLVGSHAPHATLLCLSGTTSSPLLSAFLCISGVRPCNSSVFFLLHVDASNH